MASRKRSKKRKEGTGKSRSSPAKPRRLYRSKQDRMVAGVCGGLGEYFSTDPLWFRLAFLILFFGNGIGALVYIVMWIAVPENPKQNPPKEATVKTSASRMARHVDEKDGKAIFGAVLILLGLLFLFDNLFPWFSFHLVWPVLLILLGLYLVGRSRPKGAA